MRTPEIRNEDPTRFIIEYFECKQLIGTDILDDKTVARIKSEIESGQKMDPVIIYDYKK
jgi:hypothetical protein